MRLIKFLRLKLLFIFLVNLIICELVLTIFFYIRRDYYLAIDTDEFKLSASQIENLKENYDSELGWNITHFSNLHQRPSPFFPIVDKDKIYVQTYGDSFTFGWLMNDDQTWQSIAEKKLKAPVVNFGVPAFGTDQALIYFLQNKAKGISSKFAVLAFIDGDFVRNLTSYRNIQKFIAADYQLTKPRFELAGNVLNFIPNPIKSSNDLWKLSDSRYIQELVTRDWFYRQYKAPQFPRLMAIFRPEAIEFLTNGYILNHELFVSAGELFAAQVKLFRNEACSAGIEPIVVRYVTSEMFDSVSDIRPGENFETFCEHFRINCFFPLKEFSRIVDRNTLYLQEKGKHYSVAGNKLFGTLMTSYLQSLENKKTVCR